MEEKNFSKEFILDFFKEATLKDESGVLIISDVKKEIEDFLGKKSPYKLVFDIQMHDKIKDSELIMQGSYFLQSLRDYLLDKGTTSIMKINIPLNYSELKNYKIIENMVNKYDFFTEFSFLTIFQYLNEKKQTINQILIKNNEILDIDLNKFKVINFLKEDNEEINLIKSYDNAKQALTDLIKKDTIKIKTELKNKLERELQRIKSHYFKQIQEKDEEVEKCEEKIKLLKSKLKHTFYERDIMILKRLIRESTQRLENLKKRTYKERLITEEQFHINDELEKHCLSIKNSLINVTLYYYPIYDLTVANKSKNKKIKYDPIFKKII